MIPESLFDLLEIEQTIYPSTTYKLDLQTKRIGSKIDGIEAAVQAATKIFLTERYANVIYSGDYGIELEFLVGKDYDFIVADLQRRIEEAFLPDDRFEAVTDVTFEKTGLNSMLVNCSIQTIQGAFTISTEVQI